MARGRGRPSIFEDPKVEKQLKAFMRLRPTLKDTAAFFDVHSDTIEKHIKKKYKKKFSEFRETYMVHTRFNVVRALLRAAEGGNVKAIELALSYFCKWQNKIEQETTGKIDIQYNVIPPKND
jgi:Mg2+ and Co2+ transporter CorA